MCVIFHDAQNGCSGFLVERKKEKELACQLPTGCGKTYIIQFLTLNGEFENITIIVMSRLIVLHQTYSKYYRNNNSLQIEFFCSEDDRDDDSDGDDDDDFELPPELDTTGTNKGKVILTTYASFPKLVKHLKNTKQMIDMTIFDEAHNCTGERVSTILNDESDKHYLGYIRHFSATLNREINRGTLFDYSFSKAVQNRIIRDFDIQCVIAPKGTEHNEHNYLLGEITKIAQFTKSCRYLGFCQWSEVERESGSNVLAMIKNFKTCSDNQLHWIEGVTGKDSRKQREGKLKKFQEDDNNCRLKLLVSCRSMAEGVDLKNIHGCIFFDPRQSEIEIKQIIGRSVRLLRDEDNNVLSWDQQTPSNIILPLYFDTDKVQEFEDDIDGESNYLKEEIINQENGMFANIINVIAVLKEYEPIFQFKFYLKRQKSKNDNDEEELIPVIPENDVDDDLTTTTNKIIKKVVLSCSDEMFTLLRMNPNKLKNGLIQLEMGLRDGSLNGFFRKEDFFKKIQECKDKMNEYIQDVNNLTEKWSRQTIMGKYLKSWMDKQFTFVNNPDKNGGRFVNEHPGLIDAVKDLQAYELECQQQQYYIGIDHIKRLMNEYIQDVNNLTEKWSRQTIMGKYLKSWMDKQFTFVNNPDKNGGRFVNEHPGLIDAVKDLQAYELECQQQQYYIGIDHIKRLMNEYIQDVNNLTEQWSRQTIMGKYLKSWMDKQFTFVKNPDKNGNLFVNEHPGLIDAVKDLQAYVLECQKQFQELKKKHKKKNVHQLNNVDMNDNLDADDNIDQESVITMTSIVDDDQECVQSSRKRSVALEEDDTSTTTRRGPKPRKNGYSVNDLQSDKETYFYVLRYGLTNVYKGGWSSCVKRRLAEINDSARKSLAIKFPNSHCIFHVIYTKKFECQQKAHEYEQRFFGKIEVEKFVHRLNGEYYDIDSETIDKILRNDNRVSNGEYYDIPTDDDNRMSN